ncbi:hypothetical protein [Agromyces humi]|uniref:hypothetical protein n=1 Tax=Agromyces humi TaxID=1766800 RepID=UPI00135C2818|nr:hypothetical protein [Agromyces humi]
MTSPTPVSPSIDLHRKVQLKEEVNAGVAEVQRLETLRLFGWWRSYGILLSAAVFAVALALVFGLLNFVLISVPSALVAGVLLTLGLLEYSAFTALPARIKELGDTILAKREAYNALRTPEMPVEVTAA